MALPAGEPERLVWAGLAKGRHGDELVSWPQLQRRICAHAIERLRRGRTILADRSRCELYGARWFLVREVTVAA